MKQPLQHGCAAAWSEDMNQQETIRKLEQSIANAQKQIEILKKQPEPGVGQVWNYAGEMRLLVQINGRFHSIDEYGHSCDDKAQISSLVTVRSGTFVANSLAEYFASKQKAG